MSATPTSPTDNTPWIGTDSDADVQSRHGSADDTRHEESGHRAAPGVRARAAWWLLGAAAASWGAGQAHWSVNELLLNTAVPFPSLADAGFLGFPVLAAMGLWLTAGRAITSASRLRAGLDGSLVATGVFTVSWTTVLGPVYRGGADTPFALVISIAYPVGDVLLVALSLLLLARVRGRRPYLLLLMLAPIAMTVADSGFAYLTTVGTYQTGVLTDLGCVVAFALLGTAAQMASAHPTEPAVSALGGTPPSALGLALPYVPVVVSIFLVADQGLNGELDLITVVAATLLVMGVLARQAVTVAENRRLLVELGVRHLQMREMAFHDPLTGLRTGHSSPTARARRWTTRHEWVRACGSSTATSTTSSS